MRRHSTGVLAPIVGPDLLVLFVGINPSLRSAEVGHHFARPGNRFYPALYAAGFTPRLLKPQEDALLPSFGVGSTNIAARPTRAADELSAEELRQGAAALESLVERTQPRVVAMLGLTAYRIAFGRRKATWGLQPETIGGRPVWILPNPSGLNAHYKPADFARLYREVLDAAQLEALRAAPPAAQAGDHLEPAADDVAVVHRKDRATGC